MQLPNFPKDPNDWYFLGGVGFAVASLGAERIMPAVNAVVSYSAGLDRVCLLPDSQVHVVMWTGLSFAGGMLFRWITGGIFSTSEGVRTLVRMLVNKEVNIEVSDSTLREKAQKEWNEKHPDGFNKVDRTAVDKAKAGMVMNTSTVDMPKMNVQKHFFECVLRMYDLDPVGQSKVDMTEDTWHTRRKLLTQAQLKFIKDEAKSYGAFKRRHSGTKAPFVVADRGLVEKLYKDGFPDALPH